MIAPSGTTALVRGSGDIGSAVAHHLFLADYAVLLHDGSEPTTTRRGMAFTDAIFDGRAELAGVRAARVADPKDVAATLARHELVAVTTVPDFVTLLATVRPAVLIDARMRKRAQPEPQRGLAPLTIGLGPNFVAGENVDLAIETSWDDLGAVIARGPTRPLAGEPRALAGHARDRYIYAPVAGRFRTERAIGDFVAPGEIVARIGDVPLPASLAGALRGLTRDGVPVTVGTKVIEVDPRGPAAVVTGLGERPKRIAEGTLRAIRGWEGA